MSLVSRRVLKEYDARKPFEWGMPHNIPSKLILEFAYKESMISDSKFQRAQLVEVTDGDVILFARVAEEVFTKLEALPAIISSPIVNKKTLELLMGFCPKDFQAVPVCIKNHPEAKKLKPYCNKDYFLINPLHEVMAINEQQSKLKYSTSKLLPYKAIIGIDALVFNLDSMGDKHIALDATLPMVMISRALAEYLNKHHIKGIELITDATSVGYDGT